LKDLAGLRVLAFPPSRLKEVNAKITDAFADWTPDPVRIDEESEVLAFKYHGFCHDASSEIRAEIQIVPGLVGAFWEVEHAALYKPTLELKGVIEDPEMRSRNRDVYRALKAFEDTFQEVVKRATAKS
jgi:hypothetical protein